MLLIVFVILLIVVACWSLGQYNGANEDPPSVVGPRRYDWDNKRYWREQTKEKRDRMNRRLEKMGDKRRV
jgi:hypothetical protein